VDVVRSAPARLAAGALAALAALAAAPAAEPPRTALDQDGRSHAWEGPSGRLTVIEFAASWCAPCRQTLPRLAAFARRHPELRVLVVDVDERREDRDRFAASLRLGLPMLWDEGHAIAEHYRPAAMPAALLLAPSGEVLHTALGSRADEWEGLVERVEEQLAREQADPPGAATPAAQ
jgi:thiol-disulfide isomerase/thioredoxin